MDHFHKLAIQEYALPHFKASGKSSNKGNERFDIPGEVGIAAEQRVQHVDDSNLIIRRREDGFPIIENFGDADDLPDFGATESLEKGVGTPRAKGLAIDMDPPIPQCLDLPALLPKQYVKIHWRHMDHPPLVQRHRMGPFIWLEPGMGEKETPDPLRRFRAVTDQIDIRALGISIDQKRTGDPNIRKAHLSVDIPKQLDQNRSDRMAKIGGRVRKDFLRFLLARKDFTDARPRRARDDPALRRREDDSARIIL